HHLPVDRRHAVEDAVAQDAGIVDDAIDAAEGIERGLDDALGAGRLGHAVGIGDGGAAGGADLVHHLLCRAGVGIAFAVGAAAKVVDHHATTLAAGQERDLAADAAARAGNDDDLAVEALRRGHSAFLRLLFLAAVAPPRCCRQPRAATRGFATNWRPREQRAWRLSLASLPTPR